MKLIKFTIPLNPVPKKNNSQIAINPKTKRPFILPSKKYKEYENACLSLIPREARQNVDYPVNVKAVFYRSTAHRVDKANLEEALHDILVKAGVLADDSAISPTVVVSTDGSRVYLDRKNPRTEVEITEVEYDGSND